jgi:HK97 gp10 family phage protein
MPAAAGSYNALHFELGFRNLDAIVANFYKADAVAQEEFRNLAARYADEVAQLASFYSPYDTGFMSEHVHVRFTPSGLGFEVGWEAADFFEAGLAFYPFFQEFGTYKMQAQPSLGPAYREITPDYERAVSEAATAALARAMGGH